MRTVRLQDSSTVWSAPALRLDIALRRLVFGFFLNLTLECGVYRLPQNLGNQLPSYSDKHDGRWKAVLEFHGRQIRRVF